MDTERQTNLDEVISQFNRICRVLSQCLEHNATIQQHILDETRELISQVCVDSSFASILIKANSTNCTLLLSVNGDKTISALQINVLFLTGSFMKFFSFCKKCPGLRRQL